MKDRAAMFNERYEKGVHFKLVGEHRPNCHSAHDAEAFIVDDGHEYRDRIGRRQKSGQRWSRFRCNDSDCDAVMLVRWDALSRFVTAAEAPK